MAGFKTHITTSTVLGIGYAVGAKAMYDVPLPACALAGGLCSISGMLPDLDSGPGVPLRESVTFAAAVVPMLLIDRFEQMGLAPETMVLLGAGIYLFIRFGLGRLLRKFTVHRGIFHSIPAMAVACELVFLLSAHENLWMRAFNAGGVALGFGSHLILDEIWSIDFAHFRLKSSFGTAIKFWSDCWWSTLATYANVIVLALMIFSDPTMPTLNPVEKEAEAMAQDQQQPSTDEEPHEQASRRPWRSR